MKTICKHCGKVHDISMPMCDDCLKKSSVRTPKEFMKDLDNLTS